MPTQKQAPSDQTEETNHHHQAIEQVKQLDDCENV